LSTKGAINKRGAPATRSSGARDPERSRAAILEAATAEFARCGLGGARVDRIAARAGANKRMLYYYFGDKDALFRAVLEAAYAEIRASEQALKLLDASPQEAIAALVRFTFRYYIEHPEFITLLNSANLHRARHIKGSKRARALNSPLIALIGAILERGAREKAFRRGVDPVQLYISIASLGYFYLGNAHTLSAIFGRKLTTRRALEQRAAHMVEVVLGFLRP
jgi:AcrR family transcriptional regulator